MKNIDDLLEEQERADDFQTILKVLRFSATQDVDDGFYQNVLSRIKQKSESTSKLYLLFFSGSVLAFLILGFGGLVFSLGWNGILEMRQTLLYGLFTAGIIVIFQIADSILVQPEFRIP